MEQESELEEIELWTEEDESSGTEGEEGGPGPPRISFLLPFSFVFFYAIFLREQRVRARPG